METRTNEVYHDLLDHLSEQKYFGEVTFYFQGGNIESNRLSERNTKSEVLEKMRTRRRKRVTAVPLAGELCRPGLTRDLSFISDEKDRKTIEGLIHEKKLIIPVPNGGRFSLINQKGAVAFLVKEGRSKEDIRLFFIKYLADYKIENICVYYAQIKQRLGQLL